MNNTILPQACQKWGSNLLLKLSNSFTAIVVHKVLCLNLWSHSSCLWSLFNSFMITTSSAQKEQGWFSTNCLWSLFNSFMITTSTAQKEQGWFSTNCLWSLPNSFMITTSAAQKEQAGFSTLLEPRPHWIYGLSLKWTWALGILWAFYLLTNIRKGRG